MANICLNLQTVTKATFPIIMLKKLFATGIAALIIAGYADAKKPRFDYSTIYVPEEGGVKFEKITDDNDAVNSENLVIKNSKLFSKAKATTLNWWMNPKIQVSPDGTKIAYINMKNKTSNIMVKSARQGGVSVQRTFRTNVSDFSWSPDGTTLCFTELRNGRYGIYLVDSEKGSIVRQISNSADNDFAGVMSSDGNHIYFHRGEGAQTYSIWSYDRKSNLFSNYSRGMNPVLIPNRSNEVYCARFTDAKDSEIWRLNFETGVEEIILSIEGRSFTTPQLSPDGRWLLVTGTSVSEKEGIVNTDIFAVRTDGSEFTQLTYHPGHDLSAVWSPDGKSIFFLSQRGSSERTYNVWKMNFNL